MVVFNFQLNEIAERIFAEVVGHVSEINIRRFYEFLKNVLNLKSNTDSF